MSEQRMRLERALRGCAERGAPADTVDLWPAVRERVGGARVEGEQAAGRLPAGTGTRRPPAAARTVLSAALAALSVLILGAVVYAASGPVGGLIENGPPGPAAPGSGETPGEEVGQTKSVDGARVTLTSFYAEEDHVVVGYEVEDLRDGRRVGEHPAELQPLYDFEGVEKPSQVGGTASAVVGLTDRDGTAFRMVDNTGQTSGGPDNISRGPLQNTVAFEPGRRLEPGDEHRFRLTIPLVESPVVGPGEEGLPLSEPLKSEPFVFDLEVPGHEVRVVEVGQKDTAGATTLTLERVILSLGRPQAVLCLEPRDGVRNWSPYGKDMRVSSYEPVAGEGNCLRAGLGRPLDGRSSVTVDQIDINTWWAEGPHGVIRGPWKFEFEVPEP